MDGLMQFFATAPVNPDAMGQYLWLIIALPLLGAFISGVFGKALGRDNVGLIACGAVGGSFLLSLLALWVLNDGSVGRGLRTGFSPDLIRYAIGHDYGTWFAAGNFQVHFGLFADHLSGSMLAVITGVGLLIHIYSTSYMEHDEGYWRYFAYLNLFVAMMLTLVLADNLVLLFVGWEGVGMCSYLLIGFWYSDPAKAWAGRKAFVTNRIGDFGFLVGAFLLVLTVEAFARQSTVTNFEAARAYPDRRPYAAELLQTRWKEGLSQTGPLNFRGLEEMVRALPSAAQGEKVASLGVHLGKEIADGPLKGVTFGAAVTAVLLLFLLGAAGKSAQLPLYVWLPDAMAGPTPVSALIHAATMVTAGVYLFVRLSYLLVLSPTAMAVVTVVGALTALLAALIAFAQDDIKKVLAYSTVSQLGYMFMAVGMGVFWAAFLHVVTHAMFKACLFLGAGSVMHGNGDETDIKKLGGLRKEMKWTWATFAVSTLAITGIVPLSGFFSKDGILHGIHSTHLRDYAWVSGFAWGLGLLTALCTAFYMTRLYLLTFEGERAKDAKLAHAHESSWAMVGPLVVLAALSVITVVHGLPHLVQGETLMENYLSPVLTTSRLLVARSAAITVDPEHGIPWGAFAMAWAIALAGGAAAFALYRVVFPARAGQPVPAPLAFVQKVARNKFYVDEVYEALVIAPLKAISFVLHKAVDALLIDTLAVRGTAWVTARVGSMLRYVQTGDMQSYAAVMALALVCGLAYMLFAQVMP